MADKLTKNESSALKHWSEFGQKGEPQTTRVTPSGWKTTPYLTPITSSWDQCVPRSELSKLLNGFQPQEMEDKWFVYADGPDAQGQAVVHMFRSWTGRKMVEVKVQVPVDKEGGFVDADSSITEITWESNQERYRDQTKEGAKSMVKEVCNWCMNVSLP